MKLLTAIIPSVWLFLFAPELWAQELFFLGSRAQALGGTSVVLDGCWSVFGNQAGLASCDRVEIGGSFQNRFLVKELSVRAGLLVVPIQNSVFAVSVYQFGKMPFRQDKLGITYARQLTGRLGVGMQFNYYRLFFSEENRGVGSVGFELGFRYQFAKRLVFGMHAVNPYKTKIQTRSGILGYPSLIKTGVLYHLSDSFSIMSEVENNLTSRSVVKTGMEYSFLNKLYLRLGIAGRPYQLSSGFGFQVKKLVVDLATSYHPYLGNSPSVSFQLKL